MRELCSTQTKILYTCAKLLARCVLITADAKCQTQIAYNDFFQVHRQLLEGGILVSLCISQFQLLTSPGRPPGISHILFAHPPRCFTYKVVPGGPGFRRGKIFPEMNENLLNIFIFKGCFQEAIQNGRKTLVFVYANCICLLEYLY